MRSTGVAAVATIVLLMPCGSSRGDARTELTRWNGFTSTAFTQGYVRTDCAWQEPCQNDQFELAGGLDVHCPLYPLGSGGFVNPCVTDVVARVDEYWILNGFAGRNPEPGGEVGAGTWLIAYGQRVGGDLFGVGGAVSSFNAPPGTVEVAVFRYSGDPTVFDGLEVDSIQDVVDLGLIERNDILAAETFEASGNLDLLVSVAGLPDDEIVIFAAGDARLAPGDPPAVPATTTVGSVLLLLIVLALGSWTQRNRRAPAA